jgi:transmembrane sensor
MQEARTMAQDDRMLNEAAEWAVRTGDSAFDDWDGFTAWLECAPGHAEAYDLIIGAAADAAAVLGAVPVGANDDQAPPAAQRRRWFGGIAGMAAVLAAIAGAWQLRDQTYSVITAPGETQVIELDGGGQVTLAGGTILMLDRADPARVALEQGQALFTMYHDEGSDGQGRPFRVEVGGNTLVDIGTVFDVRRDMQQMSVAVSEGAVLFNPQAENVRVAPGQQLSVDGAGGAYRVTGIPAGQVGEWRVGRLTFQDRTVGQIAAELTRLTGRPFKAGPAVAGRRVSGSVLLAPVRADPASVGPLLGVSVSRSGDNWMFEAD